MEARTRAEVRSFSNDRRRIACSVSWCRNTCNQLEATHRTITMRYSPPPSCLEPLHMSIPAWVPRGNILAWRVDNWSRIVWSATRLFLTHTSVMKSPGASLRLPPPGLMLREELSHHIDTGSQACCRTVSPKVLVRKVRSKRTGPIALCAPAYASPSRPW